MYMYMYTLKEQRLSIQYWMHNLTVEINFTANDKELVIKYKIYEPWW